MKICIIGLGLIGGSIAIDLRKRGFTNYIIGVDSNKLHLQTALNIGLIDHATDLEEAIHTSELIILAIPANETIRILPGILDRIEHQFVTDTCSI